MAGIFETILSSWTQLGFFQYLFPFLLALAVIYGILHWTMAKRMPKSALSLISLILSFFVMLFAGSNPGIVSFLTLMSGSWLIIGSGILFLIVMLGMVGFKIEEVFAKGNAKWALILAIVVIMVVIFFGAGGGALVSVPGWATGSGDLWTIVFFVVILAVVLLLMGQENGETGEKKPVV